MRNSELILFRRSFSVFYTKHHLKFRKIKPTILNICDFGADFFFILLVFSIITPYRNSVLSISFRSKKNHAFRIICTATFIPSAAADIIPPA